MSLFSPFFLGCQPTRIREQDFALRLVPDDLSAAITPLMTKDYYQLLKPMKIPNLPWPVGPQFGSLITSNKDKYQVNLDVQHFSPEEISVKTTDGCVIVEGKHEERQDEHGYISRQFTRRYILPEYCNPDTVESRLSSDGVLTVIAPRIPTVSKNERVVPITQTGPVRKEMKEVTTEGGTDETKQ